MRAKALYIFKAIRRRVFWGPADLLDGLRHGGGDPVPPRGISFVGHGDFLATGSEFLRHFIELGGLRSDDRVLDVGCGCGRMAIPLSHHLDGGSYRGFDVGRAMVRWCRRRITPRHPEFQFTWSPVYNQKYNPFGTISAAEFDFPYEDDSFDFALATSLFTHLTAADAEHYLAELGRVLRPGGAALLTFFLIVPEAEREIAAGRAEFEFTHEIGGALTADPHRPEESIAFRLEHLTGMLERAGLAIREPLHRGSWAGGPDAPSLQDIVVVEARGG